MVQRLIDNQGRLKPDNPRVAIKPDPSSSSSGSTQGYNDGQNRGREVSRQEPGQGPASVDSSYSCNSQPKSQHHQLDPNSTPAAQTAVNAVNAVNYAQSVILNISSLPNGQQVMLVTGQGTSQQLSLLPNHSTPLQGPDNIPDNRTMDVVATLGYSVPSQRVEAVTSVNLPSHSTTDQAHQIHQSHLTQPLQVSQGPGPGPSYSSHYQQPLPHVPAHVHAAQGPGLARSASLCDPHSSYINTGMQRSYSEETGIHVDHNHTKNQLSHHPINSHVNTHTHSMDFIQGINHLNSQTQPSAYQDSLYSTSFCQPALYTVSQCPTSSSLVMETQCSSVTAKMAADNSMYQSMYSNQSDNENSIVNSLLDELNSNMLADGGNSNHSGKTPFGHLGDSFESLQASLGTLQGTDLNLDQLDLIDMPDLENMCNDLTNSPHTTTMADTIGLTTSSASSIGSFSETIREAIGCDTSSSTVGFANSENQSIYTQPSCEPVTSSHSECTSQSCKDMSRSEVIHQGHQGQGDRKSCGGHVDPNKTPCTIATITDFSPDWAYTEVSKNPVNISKLLYFLKTFL